MLPAHAQSYQAWLVDLDGTLYRPTLVKLAMAFELGLLGWGAVRTLRTFRDAHEQIREGASELTVGNPFERQLEHAARALGRPRADVERLVHHWMFERPLKWVARSKRGDLLLALEAYRAQGGKTGLVCLRL